MAGPLDSVRILDLTTVVMGPYATQILADYGADVIKVEPPAGDMMRHAGPMKHAAMGPIFLQANRNKRSVVLDLKHAAGRSALLQLISGADVFVTNTRPAAMRRLSLGYEDLAGDRPGLIYVSLVGFDQSGPNAPRPAYDDVIHPWLSQTGSQASMPRTRFLLRCSCAKKQGKDNESKFRCSKPWQHL